ncbi:hypothetical protein [Altererythrobacter sp. MTPC7]|uniref:hypothetical protein n=1 Tax=Altererythrobacter sp. MTPC7 TaxID=3056567 RepID=UPI0036F1D2F6
MSRFDYLTAKVTSADFTEIPFRHIHIDDFFSDSDFDEILASPEIKLPPADNDDQLFENLEGSGYKVIEFPGCITDRAEYLRWRHDPSQGAYHNTCEGFGMTLRLFEKRSEILRELDEFLASDEFNRAIAEKFDVDFDNCTIDGGIQKYLDGYEISPHPDIRRKAATFMVNINPHEASEEFDHHTHYMQLKPERAYVGSFWEGNPDFDRAWVPWDWCQTVTEQRRNNSIVLFSPSNDTIHAVRARYDHLKTQRTQLYGNLWYDKLPDRKPMKWEHLDLRATGTDGITVNQIKGALPKPLRKGLKNVKAALPWNKTGKRKV